MVEHETPYPEVVCLVYFDNGKFLLEERLDENVFKHTWTTTGGKVDEEDREHKDYILAASIREAKEENGLIPTAIVPFTKFHKELRDGTPYLFHGIHVVSWEGELINRFPKRRRLEWVNNDRALELVTGHEVDQRLLEDFHKYLLQQENK
jgi:8-oxo-dGTP pyrophosphatase MutT (NUDIX family)